ncbi:MAG: phosphoribosyltransferase family protein [Micromonosporaceae bacterium]
MTAPTAAYQARIVTRLGVSAGVRNVRVIHQLDGIENEVYPSDLLSVGHQLWSRWRRHESFRDHDLILGLDAGGILPTVAVALATGTPYRLAWKLNLDLPDKLVFHELHARRTEVFTYGRLGGRRVLIVDDEVTTGRTLAHLVDVLRQADVDVVGVACLVEDAAGGGRRLLESVGVGLCALTTL